MNTLFIRADATTDIGTGHVMRCLALAQAWQDQGGKVTFISHCENPAIRKRLIEEGLDFITIEKPHPDPSDFDRTMGVLRKFSEQNLKNPIWLVIDGYHFDAAYQKRVKDAGYKLLWIDDYGHSDHYYADLVLNQNITADESFYIHREPDTRLLLGTHYALLRREFKQWRDWQREIPTVAGKVLVTLGGGDPNNVTLKVIRALKHLSIPGLAIKIIVGSANTNLQTLEREISDHTNLQLIKNAVNMPELMAWADIAIAAGGSTNWEIALLGLPALLLITADNQQAIAEALHNEGPVINMGWFNKVSINKIKDCVEQIMRDKILREQMRKKAQGIIDGCGSNRVIKCLKDVPQ